MGFRIVTKINGLAGLCLAVALTFTLVLLWRTQVNVERDQKALTTFMHQMDLARVQQVNFKKQVQEWKDILLRGHNADDFQNYRGLFFEQESLVQKNVKELIGSLDQASARAKSAEFLKAHEELGRRYHNSLAVFEQSGRLDYQAADRMVRGMDRAPTDLIDAIVGSIENDMGRYKIHHASDLLNEQRYMLMTALTVFMALMLASILIARHISRPIHTLAQTMSKVSTGKDYSLRAVRSSRDELGLLTDVFNEMLAKVQLKNAALQRSHDDLVERVAERIRAEEALRDSEALYHSLVEQLPVNIYRKDAGGRYVFANSRFCQLKGVAVDQILGKTVFDLRSKDVAEENEREHELIMETGKPIELEESYPQPDGSTQYFRILKSPVFSADGRITGTQGVQFDITDLRRAQGEAMREHARFKLIFDSVPVGISLVLIRPDGTLTRVINDAHLSVCGLTREEADIPENFIRISHPDDWTRQTELTGQVAQGRISQFSMEKRYVRPDGSLFWAAFSYQRRQHPDGSFEELSTVVDITERKRAEAEREQNQKQLLEYSRQAGKAEVASSVLHNIGNVLNSVNVSVSIVSSHVKKTKGDMVAKVAALMRDHATNLGAFLIDDPRGRQLPSFMGQLAEQLAHEKAALLSEMDSLTKNIAHIKDIVAMQQNYARISGVTEKVTVTDLAEDALRMSASALLRHDVRLFREYEEHLPEINVEKHKVLQILVNLIRNAKQACDETGSEDKKLTICVTNGNDRVRIALKDNGAGIESANLNRIFNYGFTTKKDGHGFGLHSSCLAAKEMGGTLTAHSDGPGMGATFVLDLPCQLKDADA